MLFFVALLLKSNLLIFSFMLPFDLLSQLCGSIINLDHQVYTKGHLFPCSFGGFYWVFNKYNEREIKREMWVWNLLTWNVTTVLTMWVAMITLHGMCLSGGPHPRLSSTSKDQRVGNRPCALAAKSVPVDWDWLNSETWGGQCRHFKHPVDLLSYYQKRLCGYGLKCPLSQLLQTDSRV